MVYNINQERGAAMTEKHFPHKHGAEQDAEHLREQLENTENFEIVANVFKLLDDTSRIRIFWLLCHFEECVINISAMTDMKSPAVSHHLHQLKNSGLIVSRRDGKEVYYKAADTEQCRLLHHYIENIMEISCPKREGEHLPVGAMGELTEAQAEQVETAHEIHEFLIKNLDKHITIDELSRRYLLNTTTLKAIFKEVYGTSIAAHIKEHRMEKAVSLLLNTDYSIADIARAVGYGSQSKLTAAFRSTYGVSPTEYRKQRKK